MQVLRQLCECLHQLMSQQTIAGAGRLRLMMDLPFVCP